MRLTSVKENKEEDGRGRETCQAETQNLPGAQVKEREGRLGGTVLDSRVVLKDSGKDFGESLFQKSPVRGAPPQHPESRSAFASLSCLGIGLGKSDLSGNTVTALRVQHLGLLTVRDPRGVFL